MKSGTVNAIRALGAGKSPESLGLERLSDGFIDMRGIRLPRAKAESGIVLNLKTDPGARGQHRGVVEFIPDRPIFTGLRLERVDFSRAVTNDPVWEEVQLDRVRFDNARMRGSIFRSGSIKDSSLRHTDLRETYWGSLDRPGPDVEDVDFSEADLRGATFGWPLFRRCRFSNTKLKGVEFFGARFEDCVFEGVLEEVSFYGRFPGGPGVQGFRNSMKNMDFSNAELRWVEFSMGIDLTSCKFPTGGYVKIPHPEHALAVALQRIKTEWTGEALTRATFFLENILKRYQEEQPFTILRPQDLIDSPMGAKIGSALVDVILEAARDQPSR